MWRAPPASTKRLSGSASSSSSASAVARCTRARIRFCCCLRRERRGRSNRRTTEMANCTSRSRLLRTSWPAGNRGCKPEELRWKKKRSGSWEDGAFTSETPTGTCSNWRRRAFGPCIEIRREGMVFTWHRFDLCFPGTTCQKDRELFRDEVEVQSLRLRFSFRRIQRPSQKQADRQTSER